jgi:hypothetical protein
LTRNAGKLGGAGVVILALGIFQSILVARWLGPKDFGVAALILGVPMLIFTFFDPQTREAVVKYLGEFTTTGESHKALAVPKLAYVIDGALGIVGVAVVALLAPWAAAHILHDSSLVPLLIVWRRAGRVGTRRDVAPCRVVGRFDAIVAAGTTVARPRSCSWRSERVAWRNGSSTPVRGRRPARWSPGGSLPGHSHIARNRLVARPAARRYYV